MADEVNFFNAGASLAGIDSLDVDALRLLFRLECSGEDFYNGVADRIGNDQAADLLRLNGREEIGHANRLRRAIAIKCGGTYEPDATDLDAFRALACLDLAVRVAVASDEILPAIVQGEIDGDAGYQRWADNEPDPEVARLLRLNGREETVHAERVGQVIALLQEAGSAP